MDSCLIKEITHSSLAPFLQVRIQGFAVCNLEEAIPRTPPCCHADIEIPASRTVRNNSLLLISHSIYGEPSTKKDIWSKWLSSTADMPVMLLELDTMEFWDLFSMGWSKRRWEGGIHSCAHSLGSQESPAVSVSLLKITPVVTGFHF